MAITILNNQPVRFRRANESTLEQIQECYQKQLDFCNKSNCDDTVAFQVNIGEVTYGSELVAYPTFNFPQVINNGGFDSDTIWVKGTGWTISAGEAHKAAGVQSGLVQENRFESAIGRRYFVQVQLLFSDISAGAVQPYIGTTALTAYGSNGEYLDLGEYTDVGIEDFTILANSSFAGDVDNARAYAIRSDLEYWIPETGVSFTIGTSANFLSNAELKLANVVTTNGGIYKLELDVTVSSGTLTITQDGTVPIATITTSGSYTFIFQEDIGLGDTYLHFNTNSPASIQIENVSLKEQSGGTNLGWGVKNTSTGEFEYVEENGEHVDYYAQPDDSLMALVQFGWSDILPNGYSCVEGCYSICIFDLNDATIQQYVTESLGSELITNGGFDADADWNKDLFGTASGNFSISGGLARVTATNGNTYGLSQVSLLINESISYRLTYSISESGTDADRLHAVYSYNSFPSSQQTLRALSSVTAGAKSIDFIASNNGDTITFYFEKNVASASPQTRIDNVSLKRIYVLSEGLSSGELDSLLICSEPFCVGTHNCTKLLRWRNDENAYNFDYESDTSFYFYMRLSGRLGRARYPKDKKNFENSNADNTILYSQTDKVLEYVTDHLPEYIHDALSIAIEHDTFEILDTDRSDAYIAYVSEEEDYDPDWEDELALAKVRFELKEATPDSERENSNC